MGIGYDLESTHVILAMAMTGAYLKSRVHTGPPYPTTGLADLHEKLSEKWENFVCVIIFSGCYDSRYAPPNTEPLFQTPGILIEGAVHPGSPKV